MRTDGAILPTEFRNEPLTDFSKEENAAAMRAAIEQVKSELGREYPLIIGGERTKTETQFDSINPANRTQVVGKFQKATKELANRAGDVVDIVVADGEVHGQHEAALEQTLSVREAYLEAEGRELMHRLPTPLHHGADSALLQELSKRVTALSLDLVVLEGVEMGGVAPGCRRQRQLLNVTEELLIERRDGTAPIDDRLVVPELEVQNRRWRLSRRLLSPHISTFPVVGFRPWSR